MRGEADVCFHKSDVGFSVEVVWEGKCNPSKTAGVQ